MNFDNIFEKLSNIKYKLKEQKTEDKELRKKAEEFLSLSDRFKKEFREKVFKEAEEKKEFVKPVYFVERDFRFLAQVLPPFVKNMQKILREIEEIVNAYKLFGAMKGHRLESYKVRKDYLDLLAALEEAISVFRNFLLAYLKKKEEEE